MIGLPTFQKPTEAIKLARKATRVYCAILKAKNRKQQMKNRFKLNTSFKEIETHSSAPQNLNYVSCNS